MPVMRDGRSTFQTSGLRKIPRRVRENPPKQLKADFEAYLDGFSPNVQDILDNFEFRNQIPRLSKADALGTLIEKFTSPDIDLSPRGLDNHGMGTVFEELVRRFNEQNNEEAGATVDRRRSKGRTAWFAEKTAICRGDAASLSGIRATWGDSPLFELRAGDPRGQPQLFPSDHLMHHRSRAAAVRPELRRGLQFRRNAAA